MSSHPNVILLLAIKPDDLARKTYRALLADEGIEDDGEIKIEGKGYSHSVMESDYDDSYQISADEGDIIVFDMVTYGYGATISWADLEKQKDSLEVWAKAICEKHRASYKISVTANYW